MSASDIAAWWGATIATAVLVFDIFKWLRTGVAIKISIQANLTELGAESGGNVILLRACNRGDKTTTITHIGVYEYASRLDFIRNKLKARFIVAHPDGPALPHELQPGKIWTATMNQSKLEKIVTSKYVYCALAHSASDHAQMKRIHLQNQLAS
ncbi:MAG: hypothetical protein IT490_10650 [Candidatus Contendobacter sp.]|nr:hypothetical protein [Candidatus Contendobacter sp.]